MGQRDVAAEREEREAKVGAVAVPAEESRAEADREAVGDQAAFFGRDEVAELVYEDREAERKERESYVEDRGEHW